MWLGFSTAKALPRRAPRTCRSSVLVWTLKNSPQVLKPPNWPTTSHVTLPLDTITCTLPSPSNARNSSSQRLTSSSTVAGIWRITSASGTPSSRASWSVIRVGWAARAARICGAVAGGRGAVMGAPTLLVGRRGLALCCRGTDTEARGLPDEPDDRCPAADRRGVRAAARRRPAHRTRPGERCIHEPARPGGGPYLLNAASHWRTTTSADRPPCPPSERPPWTTT